MAFALKRSVAGLRANPATAAPRRAARVVAPRATEGQKDGEIHYGGQTYTPAEWEAAKAAGTLPTPAPVPVAANNAGAAQPVSFGSLMAFSGPAPELINGRLAMLGVVAALAAEFASGESVFRQIAEEPTGIAAVFAIFIAASFAPLLSNTLPESESLGPFTAAAEKLNGRAAMIGFAALVAIEAVKGSALF